MKDRILTIVKSKTFWSGVVGAAGFLLGVEHVGLAEVLKAIGMVTAGAGVKDAIAQAAKAPAK